MELLDESEALELVEFDPVVNSVDTWEPPQPIENFLDLQDDQREAIKDFPRPNTKVLATPKLDEKVWCWT